MKNNYKPNKETKDESMISKILPKSPVVWVYFKCLLMHFILIYVSCIILFVLFIERRWK